MSKKTGRPSLLREDIPAIVSIAENWQCGQRGLSVRHLSRVEAGLADLNGGSGTLFPKSAAGIAGNTDSAAESKAKRLERRFLTLRKAGKIKPVSVYRVREAERCSALHQMNEHAVGPFRSSKLEDPSFRRANEVALERTGRVCGLQPDEVEELAQQGLRILQDWLPNEYPQNRI